MPVNMAGVRNFETLSQIPSDETLAASELLEGSALRSRAIACPSAEAEYCTRAPSIPEARRMPAVARDA